MNIFYFLLLLTIHNFIKTDESLNFTFTFKDETSLPPSSKIISCVAQYEGLTKTIDLSNLDQKNPAGTLNNFIAGATTPPLSLPIPSSQDNAKNFQNKIINIIFKPGGSTTTTTISFNPPLENNKSFTLKKDSNGYSATDIKENTNPTPEEKKSDDDKNKSDSNEKKSDDDKKSNDKKDDSNKSEDKKSDDDKKSGDKKTDKNISQVLTNVTINNLSGQDITVQAITFETSYTENNQQTKPSPAISKLLNKQNIIKDNHNITVNVALKYPYLLSYTGIVSIKINDSEINIDGDDIAKVAREITIVKKSNNVLWYEVPKKEADDTKTNKSAEKKDTSKPDQTLPNPTPAAQAPKNDTSSKDAFIQSLHNNQ
ncbi:hypothetical protein EBR77_02335 [bacterium]|nr:hypothetical protein [bacterium]NBX78576.1 hypothetical protein [bacterium]